METGICHKCSQQIFNGVPQGGDIEEFVKEMKSKGFELGYFHKMVGSFGHPLEERPIKPICSKCSQAEHKLEAEIKTKAQMKKVIPLLKKVYVCPIHISGFGDCNHKTEKKEDMITHIREKHGGHDLEKFVGSDINMKLKIKGIKYQDLKEILDDLVTDHDLRTYRINYVNDFSDSKNPYLPNTFILKVNKRYWIKTWNEKSFVEELKGMGFGDVEVRLIE